MFMSGIGTEQGYEQRQAAAVMPMLSALQPAVPTEVILALRFVSECNDYMQPRMFFKSDMSGACATRVVKPDFHPAQEDAFVKACICLGKYFDGRQPDGRKGNPAPCATP